MGTAQPAPVVVGVDDSTASRQAVVYAAWEAERRGATLRLVHGYLVPTPCLTPLAPLFDDERLHAAARDQLAETAAVVRARRPRLPLEMTAVRDSGAGALTAESATASLVVLGSPHHGGFARSPAGAVAGPVVAGARCPVLVVHRSAVVPIPIPGPGPVLVGVEGIVNSRAALDFGFEEASARGVALVAVHVWSTDPDPHRQERAEQVLADAVIDGRERYPEVTVRRWVVHSPGTARVLLDVAREVSAGLLVIGSHRRRGITGGRRGSVGAVLISHAEAPVAVVHPDTFPGAVNGAEAAEVTRP